MRDTQPFVTNPLEFVDATANADIRIRFVPTAPKANTYLGTSSRNVLGTDATMTFGGPLSVRIIMMEFCRALGMDYEHRNPTDNLIKLKPESAEFDAKETNLDSFKGASFDQDSIMLFVPPEATSDGKAWGPNYILSRQDALWITKTYSPTLTQMQFDTIYKQAYGGCKTYKEPIVPPPIPLLPSSPNKVLIICLSVIGGFVLLSLVFFVIKWYKSRHKYKLIKQTSDISQVGGRSTGTRQDLNALEKDNNQRAKEAGIINDRNNGKLPDTVVGGYGLRNRK